MASTVAPPPSIALQVKELRTRNRLKADPLLGPHANVLAPLLENVSNKPRHTTRRLGKGTYGHVNLNRIANVGNVATKYVYPKSDIFMEDYIFEVAALRYLRGLPNVAQLVGLAPSRVVRHSDDGNVYSSPAILLAKAETDLYSMSYNSWNDIQNVVIQILRGYYVLHERGIAHRDVKPLNMLMTATGEVQISDFGLARYITEGMRNDRRVGTRKFSAPELLRMDSDPAIKGNLDWFACDAWSIGVALFTIVTGHDLVDATNNDDILRGIYALFGPTQSIRERVIADALYADDSGALDQIAAIIEGFLRLDPTKRLTPKAALDMLHASGGAPYLAPRPSLALNTRPMPSELTPGVYKTHLAWLLNVANTRIEKAPATAVANLVLMDRAAYSIPHIWAAIPDSTPHAITCAGIYIASVCVGRPYDIRDLSMYARGAVSIREIENVVTRTLTTLDIPFYGKTVYDELLDMTEDPTLRWKLGILNLMCHMRQYYTLFETRMDVLKSIMLTHAQALAVDPLKIELANGELFKPFHRAVKKAMPQSGGGRRRRTIRRRSKVQTKTAQHVWRN